MSKDFLIFAAFMLLGFALIGLFLFFIARTQRKRFKSIIVNKRNNISDSTAVIEEKYRMKELEEFELKFQVAQNTSDVIYLRRSMVNISRILTKLVKDIPSFVRVDSNLLAENVSFATSSYLKNTIQEMIKDSVRNGADHISIDHKELVKSNRLVYRDNRKDGLNHEQAVFEQMNYNDPMFDVKVNKPSGNFSFDLDFVFTKSNEPRVVGHIYTEEEINEKYGTEIINEFSISIEELKLYLNQAKDYIYFRLTDQGLNIAKFENGKKVSLNQKIEINQNDVYRFWSVSKVRELLKNSHTTSLFFQNRNLDGKVTFVLGNEKNYLQRAWPCPKWCEDKINGIYN